jgi:hypothetical protein
MHINAVTNTVFKVKFALEEERKAQRGSTYIDLLFI